MESFYVSINREENIQFFLLHITKFTKRLNYNSFSSTCWQTHLMFITECVHNMSCHKQYYEASKTQLRMFDIYRRQVRLVIKLV